MSEIKKLDQTEASQILELPISYEEKGKEIALKKVVKNMVDLGLDLETISKSTNLDFDKIKQIINSSRLD